uniref:Uncharacterized protein n=1 Tax=Rhizophora mucronata TaxID=61149 RepID=A0A2P2QUY3_RHIMU
MKKSMKLKIFHITEYIYVLQVNVWISHPSN